MVSSPVRWGSQGGDGEAGGGEEEADGHAGAVGEAPGVTGPADPGLTQGGDGGEDRDGRSGGDRAQPGAGADEGEEADAAGQGGGAGPQGGGRQQESSVAEAPGEVEQGLTGAGEWGQGRDGEGRPAGHRECESGEDGEEQPVAAEADQHAAEDRPEGVAQALPGAVAAEGSAPAAVGSDTGDHGSGGRGERRSGGPLGEAGQPETCGVTGQHEGGRSGGEAEQAAEEDRPGPDAVGQ